MVPTPLFPRPRNFPDREVIYHDGDIAVAIGTYDGAKFKSVGVRWTVAESPIGFPNTRGNGMWLILPDKLALYILEGIYNDIEAEKQSVRDMDQFTKAMIYIRQRTR